MAPRIVLVRAVNVGGAKLPMAEFRELLEQLGAGEVRTYIASGNAVVDLRGPADAFARGVEKALTDRYGYQREVLVRTPAQVRRALDAHPFEVSSPKYSYVCFLTATPSAEAVRKAAEVPTGEDVWRLAGDELQLRYEHGAGRSELDLGRLLRRLGVQGTARNLATVEGLLAMAEREPPTLPA